ncbi:MAG: hypothetical protein GXP27_05870 [Planctomycetes bacterium]|nr:hypothetical protein [Planctomycetota bacterium]
MRYYFLALCTLVIVCVGCQIDGQQIIDKGEYYAPPAAMMERPGPMVDGPGPGVMPMLAEPATRTFATQTTQVRFIEPKGMQIGWQVGETFAENQLTAPARYNFEQGATYRLKLTNIPGREGLVLYPSLQVYPAHPTTDAYLAHNSVPIEITDEDLDQVESNNFVTKVIYLPDPKYQELAIAGVETLVSTRLEPGVDPVAEADRRGTILAVLRMGNMDLEMPSTASSAPKPASADATDPADGGEVQQVSYTAPDGEKGQFVAPVPVAKMSETEGGVPGPMMMGTVGGPGQPAYSPISGAPGMPVWGQPVTATPIGLPGPPHLPLGKPAALKSHTIRNLTKMELPPPPDQLLIDVKHSPGLRMPEPVKHIQYSETHPSYKPGQVAYPKWYLQQPPAAN